MNVIAGFTLIKVGLRRLFSANGGFPFQLATTMRARTRIDVTRLHVVLHFIGRRVRQQFGSNQRGRTLPVWARFGSNVFWVISGHFLMSALPPKADICSALAHVRFVPIVL